MRRRPVQAQNDHITISGIKQGDKMLDIASLQIVNSCYTLTCKNGSRDQDCCKSAVSIRKTREKLPGRQNILYVTVRFYAQRQGREKCHYL
jgi:hypothetical protein